MKAQHATSVMLNFPTD